MKDILKYIPGFRTNKKWKKVIAIIYYIFCLLLLTSGFGTFLIMVSIPFIVFALSRGLKQKNRINVQPDNITPIEATIITNPNPKANKNTNRKKEIIFNVAGVTFNGIQSKLKSMVRNENEASIPYEGMSNKEILETYSEDDKIYEVEIYGSTEIKLIPDPQNKFDVNAIKVVHEELGDIGFVPAVDCKRVKKVLESGYSLNWKLIGGKYKYIEYDSEKDKDVVKTENNTYGILITLT